MAPRRLLSSTEVAYSQRRSRLLASLSDQPVSGRRSLGESCERAEEEGRRYQDGHGEAGGGVANLAPRNCITGGDICPSWTAVVQALRCRRLSHLLLVRRWSAHVHRFEYAALSYLSSSDVVTDQGYCNVMGPGQRQTQKRRVTQATNRRR